MDEKLELSVKELDWAAEIYLSTCKFVGATNAEERLLWLGLVTDFCSSVTALVSVGVTPDGVNWRTK